MSHIPWFAAGPLMGLVVLASYAILNRPVGALGSFAQIIDFARRRPVKESWRLLYMAGIVLGAAGSRMLFGGPAADASYGQLGQLLGNSLLIPLLFAGGICLGFGGRWMGGCTSGHGLCGVSSRSPGSLAATAAFMTSAVAATYLIHWLTGGLL